ncbi:hypothetical protein [Pseudomonas phage vB_Pa-PAC2]|nr:hypothetical protein Deiofobo_0419 [Pseudomonas phage Deifobo]WPK40653.1 hypothetical protein Paride_0423 [Pseudomonas phage Paride]
MQFSYKNRISIVNKQAEYIHAYIKVLSVCSINKIINKRVNHFSIYITEVIHDFDGKYLIVRAKFYIVGIYGCYSKPVIYRCI